MDAQLATKQLKSSSAKDQLAAAEWLAQNAEQAAPAALALVEHVASSAANVREWCVSALESLGPPPTAQLDELAKLVASTNTDVAYWAITLLGRAGASAGKHSGLLTTASRSAPTDVLRKRAQWALQKIGG